MTLGSAKIFSRDHAMDPATVKSGSPPGAGLGCPPALRLFGR
jgi:hypothetical protein